MSSRALHDRIVIQRKQGLVVGILTSALGIRGRFVHLLLTSTLALAAGLVPYSVAAQINLIEDGGFELGLVEPGITKLGLGRYGAWSSPNPGSCFGSTELMGLPFPHGANASVLPAYEGDEGMNLGPCFGDGSVSQSFSTVVGSKYQISLAVFGGQVTATVINASNTDLSAKFASPSSGVWYTKSYTFTATHISSRVIVQNSSRMTNGCCAPMIDDVRIVLVES